MPALAAALLLVISVTVIVHFSPSFESAESILKPGGTDNLAVATYIDSDNIIVDFEQGCRLIINPSGTKIFANPVISDDRHSVAFNIYENAHCKTVMVQLDDLEKQEEFDFCPIDRI